MLTISIRNELGSSMEFFRQCAELWDDTTPKAPYFNFEGMLQSWTAGNHPEWGGWHSGDIYRALTAEGELWLRMNMPEGAEILEE